MHTYSYSYPLQQGWRRPHGIDGRFRRRFKGQQKHAKIGFGSNKKVHSLTVLSICAIIMHHNLAIKHILNKLILLQSETLSLHNHIFNVNLLSSQVA